MSRRRRLASWLEHLIPYAIGALLLVAIQRTGQYSVDYTLLPLEQVAGKSRTMEDHFITDSGTDVTDAFRMYLRPLLGSGLPDAFRLRPNLVPKVLRRG